VCSDNIGQIFADEIDKAKIQALAHLYFAPMGW
jgi:hypothetical protein